MSALNSRNAQIVNFEKFCWFLDSGLSSYQVPPANSTPEDLRRRETLYLEKLLVDCVKLFWPKHYEVGGGVQTMSASHEVSNDPHPFKL